MNTRRRLLLLGFAAMALAACASRPELSHIEDPDADFHAYRTFAFVRAQGHASLIDRRLLAAARSQLERRGYTFDELDPDLLVNVAAVMEERRELRPTHGTFASWGEVETEDFRLGRMAIDLIDTRRQQVVWHSAVEGRVGPDMLRDAGAAVEMAVAAVFEGFPVQAGASATKRTTQAR